MTTQPFKVTTQAYPTLSEADATGRIKLKQTSIADLSDATNTGSNCKLITDYKYYRVKTTINVSSNNSDCATTDIGLLNNMSRVYDVTGKLLSTTDVQGNTVTYWYDASGNPRILQDADYNEITTTFDSLGRKQEVIDPNMGDKTFI